VRRENNEEADQFVKEQKRQLQLQKMTKTPSKFGDTPLMTVKEGCSLAKRRICCAHLEVLRRQADAGSRTLCFLDHFAELQVNPTTKGRNALGRKREVIYNRLRLGKTDIRRCPGCMVESPEVVHLYSCERLHHLRGELGLDSLQSDPAGHVEYLGRLQKWIEWAGDVRGSAQWGWY
jgi:hypothetical protein